MSETTVTTIETKSSEKKTKDGATRAARVIETVSPAILSMTTIDELKATLGESRCVNYITAQLTIAFRSHIRNKLEAVQDDKVTLKYTDKAIQVDYTTWKPEERVRKSDEEKAMEALGVLSAEDLAAVMKAMKAQKK